VCQFLHTGLGMDSKHLARHNLTGIHSFRSFGCYLQRAFYGPIPTNSLLNLIDRMLGLDKGPGALTRNYPGFGK
jgi:hypothetical protein